MAAEPEHDSPSQRGEESCVGTDVLDNTANNGQAHDNSKQRQHACHRQQHQNESHQVQSSSTSLVLSISIREFFLVTLTSTPFVKHSVNQINEILRYAKVPEKSLLTNEEFVLSSTAVIITLIGYYVLFGKRHRNKRRRLAEELRLAQRQVHFLEESLLKAKRDDIIASTPTRSPPHHRKTLSLSSINATPREIRIFMDGAFDVMHYGHMNAFRLGRSLGTYLIVGVNSDESITQCKGPPLMNDDERLTMVESCKFVDMVIPNCPYIMTPEYLDYIFETYNVDYVVHGDDPCIVDGKDVYASAKRRGRYRSIPRTEGVSTTDIVGRMLLMTKEHHLFPSSRVKGSGSLANTVRTRSNSSVSFGGGVGGGHMRSESFDDDYFDSDNEILDFNDTTIEEYNAQGGGGDHNDDVSVMTAANVNARDDISVLGHQSKFLTTSMMLRLFSADVKSPEEGMKVIYVDGAWDMFHCGHVAFLKEVSKRGDYVIVGIHGDSVVNKRRGGNLPLMNLHERLLSVLGCKFMNDVLIDAPLEITPDMIASLRISEVVHGTESDDNNSDMSYDDRYRYPKEMGIFTIIPSPSDFKLDNILSRIQKKQAELQRKIDRKKRAEREWFNNKYQNGEKIGNGHG